MNKNIFLIFFSILISTSTVYAKEPEKSNFSRLYDCVEKTMPIPKGVSVDNQMYYLAGACRQEVLTYMSEYFFKQGHEAPIPFALAYKEFEHEGTQRGVFNLILEVKSMVDVLNEMKEKEKLKKTK